MGQKIVEVKVLLGLKTDLSDEELEDFLWKHETAPEELLGGLWEGDKVRLLWEELRSMEVCD